MPVSINKYKLFLFLLAIPFFAMSQEQMQIIQLKSGGTFTGKVVEPTDINIVTFQLMSGETITLNRISIASIIDDKKAYKFFPEGRFTATKGKYTTILINTYSGIQERDWDETKSLILGVSPFHFSSGLRFNNRLDVGFGASIDLYDYVHIPIFAEARYYFSQNKTSWFLGGKIGRSLLIEYGDLFSQFSKGGLMINPTIGFKVATMKKSDFILETGVRFQQSTFERWSGINKITYQRYSFGMGWIF